MVTLARLIVPSNERIERFDRDRIREIRRQRRRLWREVELDRLVDQRALEIEKIEGFVPNQRATHLAAEDIAPAFRVLFAPDFVTALTMTPDDPPNSAVY